MTSDTAMQLERYNQPRSDSKKTLLVRATGRFYTPEPVVARLILKLTHHVSLLGPPILAR